MKMLRSDKEELLRRLAALRADSERRWGKMTCHEMICHLSDAFLMALGEKTASRANVPIPRPLFKWVALYFPLQWPHGIATRPEMEQGVGGTTPVEFDGDRENLMEVMDRFTKAREFSEHPMFGKMSEKDWMRWGIYTAIIICGSLACEVRRPSTRLSMRHTTNRPRAATDLAPCQSRDRQERSASKRDIGSPCPSMT